MRRLIPLLLVSCASGPSLEEDRHFIKETTAHGAKAVDGNDFDRGVRLYEESLVAARRHPELAPQAQSIEEALALSNAQSLLAKKKEIEIGAAIEAWRWLWRRCDKLGSPLETNAPRFRGTDAERELRAKIEQLKR